MEKRAVNNPCGHTGFESAPCEICGYPDPRKLIARLKAQAEEAKSALRLLIDFIPAGWPVPLGYSQVANQARTCQGRDG